MPKQPTRQQPTAKHLGRFDIFEGARKVGGQLSSLRNLPIVGEVISDVPGFKESQHLTKAISQSEAAWDRAKKWAIRDGSTYTQNNSKVNHENKSGATQPAYHHSGVENWSSNKNAIAIQ